MASRRRPPRRTSLSECPCRMSISSPLRATRGASSWGRSSPGVSRPATRSSSPLPASQAACARSRTSRGRAAAGSAPARPRPSPWPTKSTSRGASWFQDAMKSRPASARVSRRVSSGSAVSPSSRPRTMSSRSAPPASRRVSRRSSRSSTPRVWPRAGAQSR